MENSRLPGTHPTVGRREDATENGQAVGAAPPAPAQPEGPRNRHLCVIDHLVLVGTFLSMFLFLTFSVVPLLFDWFPWSLHAWWNGVEGGLRIEGSAIAMIVWSSMVAGIIIGVLTEKIDRKWKEEG